MLTFGSGEDGRLGLGGVAEAPTPTAIDGIIVGDGEEGDEGKEGKEWLNERVRLMGKSSMNEEAVCREQNLV